MQKNHESEFHPPDDEPTKIQIIQSQKSKDAGLSQYEDHSSDGTHGTGMAARALGTLYGLAKKVCVALLWFIWHYASMRYSQHTDTQALRCENFNIHLTVFFMKRPGTLH